MAVKNVVLPDIGEGVIEGEMVKWLVEVGDFVEVDQPIAEIMTDKATVEVPSPIAGRVTELKAREGDTIPIEQTLLMLETTSDQKVPKKPPANDDNDEVVSPPVAESRVLATPGTRRLAREMNVDINKVQGTGNVGRVTREDVLASQVHPPTKVQVSTGDLEERVPLKGIRRKIAEQMQMTKQVVPHFTLMDEACVTELYHLRRQAKEIGKEQGVKITFLPFIMKALIATLRQFPEVNASIDDKAQEIVYKKYYHLGFAADTPQGLLVPNIKNADQKTIIELSRQIQELATQAREGRLALEDMKGASMTLTNIGSVGGTYATPIINYPEVAILGVYKMTDRPVFKEGEFYPEKIMNFTITCDHRLIDGAVAARFLSAFIKRIESPSHLMLEMM